MNLQRLVTLCTLITLFPMTRNAVAAGSDSASANATAKVIASIEIDKATGGDLKFGEATPGDAAKTVAATNADAAKFEVKGDLNHAFVITLPSTATMTTGDGSGADKQIVVNTFTHDQGASPNIGASLPKIIRIGGTRAAIRATQVTGSYSASFTVTVSYP